MPFEGGFLGCFCRWRPLRWWRRMMPIRSKRLRLESRYVVQWLAVLVQTPRQTRFQHLEITTINVVEIAIGEFVPWVLTARSWFGETTFLDRGGSHDVLLLHEKFVSRGPG